MCFPGIALELSSRKLHLLLEAFGVAAAKRSVPNALLVDMVVPAIVDSKLTASVTRLQW